MIVGFTGSLALVLAHFGLSAKLVEPGYGPGTSFIANSGHRIVGLDSPHYADYAAKVMAFTTGAGPTTTADQVASKVLEAASDTSDRLRYPAGPDSEALANARWTQTDEEFLTGMRFRFPTAA